MSRVDVKCGTQKQSPLLDMVTIGPRLLSETVKSVGDFLQLAAGTSSALPRPTLSGMKQACNIPETECPPRCVCHITWEASWHERLACNISVTNSSKIQRTFNIETLPFSEPAGSIKIVPGSLKIESGKTKVAKALYTVPDRLAPGIYRTEILVAGAYEQCVTVTLKVLDQQQCDCHVVQGEVPVRIRAHRWYDHFQCVEDCFEAARSEDRKRKG